MSAGWVWKRVLHKPASMRGDLPSSKERADFDQCCGIHGAMRERRGIKRGTSAARRRLERQLVGAELEQYVVRMNRRLQDERSMLKKLAFT